MDGMEKGGGMCFWPTPIMHSSKPLDDGSRNFFTIKSCGYCYIWFQYDDIAIINCKHTFHLFVLAQCYKTQTNVMRVNKYYTQTNGLVRELGM
jgi:hypothetical protein